MKREGIWTLLLIVALTTSVLGLGKWVHADDQVTLLGTLENSERGVVLLTPDDKYLIIGQDLTSLVGRKVKLTGEVIESRRGKSLKVTTVEIDHSQ